MQSNLEKVLPALSTRPVTNSAFSQKRYHIKSDFFKDLNQLPLQYYQQMKKQDWKGHLLFAGDGSALSLPASKEIEKNFDVYSTTSYGVNRSLARIFFLYDVLNKFVVNGQLDKMEVGEQTMLTNSIEACRQLSGVFLLDRNFGYFSSLKGLIIKQKDFCIRMSVGASGFTKRVMADDRTDFIVEWKPSREERNTAQTHNLDCDPIKIRVVKVVLNTGEVELLATSLLDKDKYSSEEMKELYHLRWGVEECFKNLKPKMKIEYFGCKKTEGVLQEFYAHIFMINMISLIAQPAQRIIERKTCKRQYRYVFNWKDTFRYVREQIIKLMTSLESVTPIIDLLIGQILRSKIPIKPNRSFPRNPRLKKKISPITHFNK